MVVEQLSIFLENKAGRLLDVTHILSEAKINIRALSLADTSDFGILRVIVDDTEKAKNLLKDRGLTVGRTNVVAVEVSDVPGGLDTVLTLLGEARINVEYMYAFVQRNKDNATLIFRFDKTDAALEVLKSHNISIVPASAIGK